MSIFQRFIDFFIIDKIEIIKIFSLVNKKENVVYLYIAMSLKNKIIELLMHSMDEFQMHFTE
jgi:hypothetical protein